jgi:DNA mismatch repair protein MutS
MASAKRHHKGSEEAAEVEDAAPAVDQSSAAPPAAASIAEATPSMAQFLEIKTANPDSILWYRMGDFYELFFEDAVVASQVLGIVLTKRGKHLGQDIPMCGVPVHRADEYLQRLIKHGYRVAVCEQLEDPAEARKRGSKAVVRRDVVRLVTPGTLTEETLLDARSRNYLTALFRAPATHDEPLIGSDAVVALASLDISTGEFEVGETRGRDLPGELVRLAPSEVVLADSLMVEPDLKAWIEHAGASATPVPGASFDSLAGERDMKARLGVADLGAFGNFSRAELAAVGALLRYVDLTQIGKKPVVRAPKRIGAGTALVIDADRPHRNRRWVARACGSSRRAAHRPEGHRRSARCRRHACRERTPAGNAARDAERCTRHCPRDFSPCVRTRRPSRFAEHRARPRSRGRSRKTPAQQSE